MTLTGKTVSHYKILEKIGEGGMGVVYKAEDTRLDRVVALKFLPRHVSANEEEKKRFVREAKSASKLDHPNICSIYGIEETDDGQLFIIMPYYDGTNLKEKVEAGPLSLEAIVDIAIQMAEGLKAAHHKKIVHRDIKSANFMLTEEGRIKIMDFGLASMAGATKLTKTGTTLGTASYMSPEQVRGEPVDHRSDIWSLGVVLYEMMTGRPPFCGDYEQAVIYSIMNEDPESVSKLHPEIPESLEQVVFRALEKDPDKRYQDVEPLLEDLRALSEGFVPEAIRIRMRRAKLRKIKRGLLFGGAAGLLIAVAAVLILYTKQAHAIDSIAVLPLKNLTGNAKQEYFVDGVTDELIGELGQISGLKRVISRTSIMQYKEMNKPLSDIARELNVDAVIEGSVYEAGDSVRVRLELIDVLPEEKNLWGNTYKRAKRDVLMLYSDVARAVSEQIRVGLTDIERTHFDRVRQVNPEAYEATLRGQFHWNKFTRQDIELSRQYFELALEKDPDYAPAYHGIANYWGAMTYFGVRPRELAPKWKAAVEKCLELDTTLADGHYAVAGFATWYEFNWEKAEREFRLALELNPNYAQARIFYGLFLTAMGRFEEAEAQMRAGIKLDPMNAMHQTYLGQVFKRAHHYDRAIEQYNKGLALQPDFTDALGNLAQCYHFKGMYEEALAVRREIFEIKGSGDLIEALEQGYRAGGYTKAMRSVAEALEARNNLAYSEKIASYYAYAGDKRLALDWLEIAYEERMQDLVYLNVEPDWDHLRDEPKFQELIRKMHFPDH